MARGLNQTTHIKNPVQWHVVGTPQILVASQRELKDCTLVYVSVTAYNEHTLENSTVLAIHKRTDKKLVVLII